MTEGRDGMEAMQVDFVSLGCNKGAGIVYFMYHSELVVNMASNIRLRYNVSHHLYNLIRNQ